MQKCTAFVLGGGGSRGALQVGAMHALLEAGIVPDLLVGTSIGAVNVVGLALWGVNLYGIDALKLAWEKVSHAQLLDPRISQLMLRAMVGRPSDRAREKVENFFVSMGINHNLRFSQIPWIRLALISADIETGQPVIFGQNLSDSILEGLLSSIALPPWFTPIEKDGQSMIDGGALCNLPIEPALQMGATEIIALDLDDATVLPRKNLSFGQYFTKYIYAVSRRHVYLEIALAEAKAVPVRCITFQGMATTPIWDFSNYEKMIKVGYEKARVKITEWGKETQLENISNLSIDGKRPVMKHIAQSKLHLVR